MKDRRLASHPWSNVDVFHRMYASFMAVQTPLGPVLWPASLCSRLIHTSDPKCHDGLSVRTLSLFIWLLLDILLHEDLILLHTLLPLRVTLSDLQHIHTLRITLPQCVPLVSQNSVNVQFRLPFLYILRINLLTFAKDALVLH